MVGVLRNFFQTNSFERSIVPERGGIGPERSEAPKICSEASKIYRTKAKRYLINY
jgi:hypothetical protein